MAVQPLTLRDTVIGQGRPKTIVPTTAQNATGALEQVKAIAANASADIIEWRIDYLDIATNAPALIALAETIGQAASNKPVIATFRTKAEGGPVAIDDHDYGRVLSALIDARAADLFDIEMFRDEAVVTSLIAKAHASGLHVILSSHDFSGTPPVDEIVGRLRRQDALGADVLKIAVMPKQPRDVLTLLDATLQVRDETSKPLLTMSMGALGVISRLAGETFGSSLTFGMMGKASAPGQIDVGQLQDTLDVLHSAGQ